MSDSDSSDDEGIPSLSALVQSLVPNAPDSSDDDDSDSDAGGGGGADAVGKLPSSISNLVQNLVQQYDSISDDDSSDSGNSSSDDDDDKNKKKNVPAGVPVDDDDDDSNSDDDDDDGDLSNLVQNILNQRAHRDSVDINSLLGPITVKVPKSSPRPSPKKVDDKQSPAKPPRKQVASSNHTHSSASTMEGTHHLMQSRHSFGLQDTMHSLPEHEAITSPLPPNPARKKITPLNRQKRAIGKSNHSESDSIQQTGHSLSLNETSHTVISAASTDSGFDPAELENALGKGPFNDDDDDNTETSSFIPHDSFSSIGEFASSVSTRDNDSKRKREKKMTRSPPKPSKSSSSTSQSASSKDNSKSRKAKSSRRKFDKEPLSPMLGKMVGDSPSAEEDDYILSPLALPVPLKKKKKSSKAMKSDSERSGSRSKRSRSSLSRSSHKSSKKENKVKKKKDKASPDRSSSRRSKEDLIPETPVSKHERSLHSQNTTGLLSPPLVKQRSKVNKKDKASLGSRQSKEKLIPETPISQHERSLHSQSTAGLMSPPMVKQRIRRPLANSDAVIPETPPSATKHSSTRSSQKKDPPSKVSSKKSIPKTPSTKQSKTKDTKETPTGHQPDSLADIDNVLSPGQESDKFSTRRTDEEDVVDHHRERPIHPTGPIHMISFSTLQGALLPLDEDISSSSTEEEDLYETESDEGEGGTEYGSVVSGSQIAPSLNQDSMQMPSVAPSSEAGYETDPADASNAGSNEDLDNEYEDEYESDKSPSEGNFGDDNAGDNGAIDDEYESDSSESFVEDEPIVEPPKRTGRRTMLDRSERQTNLTLDGLDDYESDTDEEPPEEPPKRTGRRTLLTRSVSSEDLTAVLDEYELDSDSDDGDNGDNGDDSDSFVEDEPIMEQPKRNGRRTMLMRSEKQSDISMDGMDDYESDSDEEPIEEPPKRTGRRGLLTRSVSSEDLTAVLDEYELDSDSESGDNEDYEGSRDQSNDESEDDYEPDKKGRGARERESWPALGKNRSERESWPAPGNKNPRKDLPLSDGSSSVDYTDGSDSVGLDNPDYEDDEFQEPTERSNRYDLVDENDDDDESDYGRGGEFDFGDDYNAIGVSSDEESSNASDGYSAASGSNSTEDRNYYAKLDAVTRREDQLALRSQRLKRKVLIAAGTLFIMILGLTILFIVDPLQKDVLSQGGRRLRGRPNMQ
mmetsp:Transcript_27477/g.66721  ORF Transcript_27477/g.66721 Transcript_27477/m.66721 type:complete len:1193 (-) Transcript_27477:75-3653(-)